MPPKMSKPTRAAASQSGVSNGNSTARLLILVAVAILIFAVAAYWMLQGASRGHTGVSKSTGQSSLTEQPQRPGALPETVATMLDAIRNESLSKTPITSQSILHQSNIVLNPKITFVNMGPQGAWGWTALAYDRVKATWRGGAADDHFPKLTDSLSEAQARAREDLARAAAAASSPAGAGVTIAKGELLVYLPLSRAITAKDGAEIQRRLTAAFNEADKGSRVDGLSNTERFDAAYVKLLQQTHYTTPLQLSLSEAKRCLGPMTFQQYENAIARSGEASRQPVSRAYLAAVTRMFTCRDGTKAMIPFIDLINHRNRDPTANVEISNSASDEVPHLALRATRDIAHGEEIVWSYTPNMLPIATASTYGYVDPSDPPSRFFFSPMTTIPLTINTLAAECKPADEAFAFSWTTGKMEDESLACAKAIFLDHDLDANGQAVKHNLAVEPGESPLLVAEKRSAFAGSATKRALKWLIKFVSKVLEQVPARYNMTAAIPAKWKRLPEMQETFVPTKFWMDCIDASSSSPFPKQKAAAGTPDIRREIFETVFTAEASTRAATERVLSWLQAALTKESRS
mgnify:CR=1 FL=1